MQQEVMYKKELMQLEFEFNRQLKSLEVEGQKTREQEKEDRKDQRTKIQATQQSEMIDQRNNKLPPKNFEAQPEEIQATPQDLNFESAGNDIMGGGFDLGTFDPT